MLTAERLAAAFAHHRRAHFGPLPGRTNHLKAGVLVPVVLGHDPRIVLTLRAADLRHHAGEVSFPGGKPDPTDASLQHTAIREAREELTVNDVRIVGQLSTVPVYTSDYSLTPFVGVLDAVPEIASPDEVAGVLVLSMLEVLHGSSIDAIRFTLHERVWHSPVFHAGGYRIYGATAHVLLEALTLVAPLLGRSVPELLPGRYTWETVRYGPG